MALKSDKGCGTPKNANQKQIYQRLVQLFAPLVYFEQKEQFFPVDLPTTINNSSLWKMDHKAKLPTTQLKKDYKTINPVQDLPVATSYYYTTVTGTGFIQKSIEGQKPFDMPKPKLNEVYDKYKNGVIPAELTIYATVCSARDVPNSNLISECQGIDKNVQHGIKEGLIISYYMYFPACESPEFESEGDWSGISILLKETPTQLTDLYNPKGFKRFLPVISCYYRKTIDGAPPSPNFVAGDQGFRRWKDVKRIREQSVGEDTHPIIHVSRGRHNCYYEPTTTSIKLSAPWELSFTADRIESGDYAAGPAKPDVNTLQGGGIEDFPWWGYAIFPPFLPLVLCGTGCEYPVHFDTSGLPIGYVEAEDQSKYSGYSGVPNSQSGSSYPKKSAEKVPASSKQITLMLRYVDLDDPTTTAIWGYSGAWGGATLDRATLAWDPENPRLWGDYRGAQRPALAAWFVWNLFVNGTFGCSGIPQLTRSP